MDKFFLEMADSGAVEPIPAHVICRSLQNYPTVVVLLSLAISFRVDNINFVRLDVFLQCVTGVVTIAHYDT